MTEAMATPGEKLAAELKRRGMTPTQLGELLREKGLKSGYRLIYNWTNDRGFKAQNRIASAEALGLPTRHFDEDAPEPAAEESRVERDDGRPNLTRFLAEKGDALDEVVVADLRATSFRTGEPSYEGWMALALDLQAQHRGKTRPQGSRVPDMTGSMKGLVTAPKTPEKPR